MFWFCKTKPVTVYFYTTREEVFNFSKPERASKFIPKWIKELPNGSFNCENKELIVDKNLKTCAGFLNLYKTGFMFPMWSDLNVEVDPSGHYRYQFIDRKSLAIQHSAKQFDGFSLADSHISLKLENPWLMIPDKNIDVLFSAPFWNNFGFDDIVVVPGIYDPKVAAGASNINLFFKKKQEKVVYELFLNQPLVHVIPITKAPLILKHELITEKELDKIKAKFPIYLTDRNRYNRVKKLCPYE